METTNENPTTIKRNPTGGYALVIQATDARPLDLFRTVDSMRWEDVPQDAAERLLAEIAGWGPKSIAAAFEMMAED